MLIDKAMFPRQRGPKATRLYRMAPKRPATLLRLPPCDGRQTAPACAKPYYPLPRFLLLGGDIGGGIALSNEQRPLLRLAASP